MVNLDINISRILMSIILAGFDLKILVTGASGFVGSHVALEFRQQGHETVLLAGSRGPGDRIAGRFRGAQVQSIDIRDSDSISRFVSEVRPDVCVHLAWYATPGKYLHSLKNIDMISATMNLASALEASGCERLVSVGSCFEYDLSFGYLGETSTPTDPNSMYSAAKLSTANLLAQFAATRQISVAWARLFYLYGPYEDSARLVPSITLRLIYGEEAPSTGGEQIRDYLHVEDVSRALVATAFSKVVGAINIGSGIPVTIRSIVEMIGAKTERPELLKVGSLPYRHGEPPLIVANNSLILSQTDWRPKLDIETGIEATVGWWKETLR